MAPFLFILFYKKRLRGNKEITYNLGTNGRKWGKVVDMFFGTYQGKLDDKGRVVIPSKMREEAGQKIFIMKGYDGALSIYKPEEFEKLIVRINSLKDNHKNSRDFARASLASTCELDVDKQGRVQIPSLLINKYHIGKEVVIIGVGNHIEIWDMQAYQAYENDVDNRYENIAESLDQDN